MNAFSALQRVKQEKGISTYFPITHLLEPTIFEASNTMIGSTIQVDGVAFDTEQNEIVNHYQRIWHRALTMVGENFCIYVTTHRHKKNIFLEGNFQNQFSEILDQKYHQRFKGQSIFLNDIYLTIIYKGITTGKTGKGIHFLNQLASKKIKGARELQRQNQMKCLKKTVRQLLTSLSIFHPTLLGSRDQEKGQSELLSFLSLIVNGGEGLPFKMPRLTTVYRSKYQIDLKEQSLYPNGNVGQYVSKRRLFFGDTIQFQSLQNEALRFAAMVTIKQYPSSSSTIMLDNLLQLDCEFINTHTFAIESKDVALHQVQRHMIRMENVNDPAVSQIDSLESAREMIASGELCMGYHHNTLMLFSDDLRTLETNISKVIKCYADAGIVAIKETIGQEPAFWAQIPTNIRFIARGALITSENFVDFAPLHNYKTGYRDGNHLGAAVTLLETPSRTPFLFNFHVKGSQDNPSKGHTTIIGGNGSGKTVLMSFLDAQMNRYNGRTFAFDRDRGMEIYFRACEGHYAILSPDYPKSSCFNPLQMDDTPLNRKFCRAWMAQLIKEEGELYLSEDVLSEIAKCIDYAFENLAQPHRNLTNISKLLPITFSHWSSLRRWLRASHDYNEGEYAYLFDNDQDVFALHTKMGFDMTHFLDQEPSNVLAALTMYLLHRLKQSLDGKVVTVLLDEGWQYLDNPFWQVELKKILPTFRKLNCHLVFATQSPASVIDSPLRHMILDNCATQIYFANPQAKEKQYVDGFNLTEAEFSTIKANEPNSRFFLVKQEHDAVLCKLDLHTLQDELSVLSGNKKTILLLDQLRKEVGNDPNLWLQRFYQRRRHL